MRLRSWLVVVLCDGLGADGGFSAGSHFSIAAGGWDLGEPIQRESVFRSNAAIHRDRVRIASLQPARAASARAASTPRLRRYRLSRQLP
jgi:hypothetical protein